MERKDSPGRLEAVVGDHSLIRQKMRETGALLAGEMSGHLFFRDRYLGYDDAIYASLRLLEIVAAADGVVVVAGDVVGVSARTS